MGNYTRKTHQYDNGQILEEFNFQDHPSLKSVSIQVMENKYTWMVSIKRSKEISPLKIGEEISTLLKSIIYELKIIQPRINPSTISVSSSNKETAIKCLNIFLSEIIIIQDKDKSDLYKLFGREEKITFEQKETKEENRKRKRPEDILYSFARSSQPIKESAETTLSGNITGSVKSAMEALGLVTCKSWSDEEYRKISLEKANMEYRKLAAGVHPDKGKSPTGTRMKKYNEAIAVIRSAFNEESEKEKVKSRFSRKI